MSLMKMVGINTDITEHKNLIDEAVKQEEKYKSLMQLSSDGIFFMSMDGKLLEYSDEVKKLLGYSDDELKNLYVYDWDVAFSKEEVLNSVKNVPREAYSFESKHRRKDGSIYDASISAVKITIEDVDYIYAATRDITQKKHVDEEVKNKLQKFIDTQKNIVLLTDGKTIQFSNKTFLNFFGYKSIEAFARDYKCICDRFLEKSNFFHLGLIGENESTWIESLLNLSGRARIVSILDKYEIAHAFSVSINAYDDETYVVSFSDISDTMIEKLELAKEATTDALTNLYNRVYFNKHINSILEHNETNKMRTGIILFDIDKFKGVNDTFGHDVGDYVLKTLASLVKKYTRNNDKVIRWGGEEFIIISEIYKDEALYNLAEHLRSLIEKYNFKDVNTVTCSFGCAIHDNENDILDTIKEADEKLYEAKNSGRNKVIC
jgi:diguanylate cyclase (GGDEF)-like protein/PAS domain S-box-containing protein